MSILISVRPGTLLAQVLAANLLLITVATIAASLVAGGADTGEDSAAGVVLAFAVAMTVLVNVFMLARRFRPLEQLADEMERADLSR